MTFLVLSFIAGILVGYGFSRLTSKGLGRILPEPSQPGQIAEGLETIPLLQGKDASGTPCEQTVARANGVRKMLRISDEEWVDNLMSHITAIGIACFPREKFYAVLAKSRRSWDKFRLRNDGRIEGPGGKSPYDNGEDN